MIGAFLDHMECAGRQVVIPGAFGTRIRADAFSKKQHKGRGAGGCRKIEKMAGNCNRGRPMPAFAAGGRGGGQLAYGFGEAGADIYKETGTGDGCAATGRKRRRERKES